MAGVEVGDFGCPDEPRAPDKTTVEIVRMGGERCQAHHVGLLQSGAMRVVHEDGTEQEIRAGQAYVIEPGHDAWVVGDEAVVGFEFDSRTAEEYAKG